MAAIPYARKLARANRAFAVGAAQLMARRGIGQFLDLGCGFATSPAIHQAVRAISPGAAVLYADNDPDVARHNPAIGSRDGVAFIPADLRQPGLPGRVEEFLDFSRPTGVLVTAVLHFLSWDDKPYLRMLELTRRLAPGSYLAISHVTSHDTHPVVRAVAEAACTAAGTPIAFRKRLEITEFFQGLHFIRPGLTEVAQWRANGRTGPAQTCALKFLAGVARKPAPQ